MTNGAVLATELEHVDVHSLELHPANPRVGDLDAIRESIRSNGFFGALVVQRSTRRVCAGNHRLQAAIAEGVSTVPVLWVDVDDEAAERILLADNRTAELATNDVVRLTELLARLASTEGKLAGTGYDDHDLRLLLERVQRPGGNGEHADADEVLVLLTVPVPKRVKDRWEKFVARGGEPWERFDSLLTLGDA